MNKKTNKTTFKKNILLMFSLKEKEEFFNSFYLLYSSGLPIKEIFSSMYTTCSNSNIQTFCEVILNALNDGSSFEEAVNRCPNALGKAHGPLLIAGETSGKLDEILPEIIKNIQKEDDTLKSIYSSLAYPCFLFVLAITVFMLFKFFILKVFATVGTGENICMPTLIFFTVVKIVLFWLIFLGAVIFIYRNRKLRAKLFDLLIKLPVLSDIVKSCYFMNFFNIFSLSYNAGVPVYEGLKMSVSVVRLKDLKPGLETAVKAVGNGNDIATALSLSGCFQKRTLSAVLAGEKAGSLDKALKRIADDYEKNVNFKLDILTKLLGQFTMIFIGIFVMYIVVSAYKSYYAGIMSMF